METVYFILSFELWCWQSALRSNLQYAALSTLRRLPLDSGNPAFLHRAVQGCVKVSVFSFKVCFDHRLWSYYIGNCYLLYFIIKYWVAQSRDRKLLEQMLMRSY